LFVIRKLGRQKFTPRVAPVDSMLSSEIWDYTQLGQTVRA